MGTSPSLLSTWTSTSFVSVFRAMPVSTVDTDHTSPHGDIPEEPHIFLPENGIMSSWSSFGVYLLGRSERCLRCPSETTFQGADTNLLTLVFLIVLTVDAAVTGKTDYNLVSGDHGLVIATS